MRLETHQTMSNDALNWAVKQEIRGPAKAVLNSLANRASPGTAQCWPSHARISQETGFTVSTVKVALNKLKKLELIEWTNRLDAQGSLTSNLYTLQIRTPQPGDAPPPSRETPHPQPSNGCDSAGKSPSPQPRTGYKPKRGTQTKPKENKAPWQIRKDLDTLKERIEAIRSDTENQIDWISNNNPKGGYPLLRPEVKAQIDRLKDMAKSLQGDLDQAFERGVE